jgi:hypothetical protein
MLILSKQKESNMSYQKQCEFGRAVAVSDICDCAETGNYPKLIRKIREMASQNNGVSIGFLQAIAEKATRQHNEL